jgi:hypothetical protein
LHLHQADDSDVFCKQSLKVWAFLTGELGLQEKGAARLQTNGRASTLSHPLLTVGADGRSERGLQTPLAHIPYTKVAILIRHQDG